MKKIAKVTALLGLGAVTLCASGFKIPEQSLNSTALSAAYVANANGADASYYNPANMVWNDDSSELELATTFISLSKINYTDASGISAYDGQTESESFIVPTFHYTSPAVGDFRFGLSVVAPAGLSKRWEDAYQKATAEEFSLSVIEINPTMAYKVNDKFAIGFGLRGVYTKGVVKASGTIPSGIYAGVAYENDLEADSIDFGYNLAMSYKPVENLTLSTTYRSKIDLTVDGEATATFGGTDISGDNSTQIPLPATLALAAAYQMNKTTVEFVFERTYWSSYQELDFDFTNATAETVFGTAKAKNWKDVNAYRIGVTHQYSDKLKLMAGFAIDKTPVPEENLSFELPDSDAKLYSVGFEYAINKDISIGLSYLYDEKESVSVNSTTTGISGTFEDASAQLLTASFKYKF